MKVFDLHCDTLSELRYAEEAGQPKSFAHNDLQIDLEKSTLMVEIKASLEKLPSEPKGKVRSRKNRRASTPKRWAST